MIYLLTILQELFGLPNSFIELFFYHNISAVLFCSCFRKHFFFVRKQGCRIEWDRFYTQLLEWHKLPLNLQSSMSNIICCVKCLSCHFEWFSLSKILCLSLKVVFSVPAMAAPKIKFTQELGNWSWNAGIFSGEEKYLWVVLKKSKNNFCSCYENIQLLVLFVDFSLTWLNLCKSGSSVYPKEWRQTLDSLRWVYATIYFHYLNRSHTLIIIFFLFLFLGL